MDHQEWQSNLDFLKMLLDKKRLRNPSYSLRAFSRDLGISSGQLNKIMNGRKILSVELACQIGLKLKMPPTALLRLVMVAVEENKKE